MQQSRQGMSSTTGGMTGPASSGMTGPASNGMTGPASSGMTGAASNGMTGAASNTQVTEGGSPYKRPVIHKASVYDGLM